MYTAHSEWFFCSYKTSFMKETVYSLEEDNLLIPVSKGQEVLMW